MDISPNLIVSDLKKINLPKWSILRKSLIELLCLTEKEHLLFEDTSLIEDILGDSLFLSRTKIYPDDPFFFLAHFSMEYLLNAYIEEETMKIIFENLCHVLKINVHDLLTTIVSVVSDEKIFNLSEMNNVKKKLLPNEIRKDLSELSRNKIQSTFWGDISRISEKTIISEIGFNTRCLKYIREIWRLRSDLKQIQRTLNSGFPKEYYSSFHTLVEAFIKADVKKEREYRILKGRLGIHDGRKLSLDELGNQEGLTRERIRQIEKKCIYYIQLHKTIGQLNLFWSLLDDILSLSGGICCVSEINEALSSHLGWVSPPCDKALASLISLSQNYMITRISPIRIIIPNHPCVICSKIIDFVADIVQRQPDGVLELEKANILMLEFCHCQGCAYASAVEYFSKGYFDHLDKAIEDILIDGTAFYTQYAYAVKYGKNPILIIDAIFYNAGNAMHFKEILEEMNKGRPADEQFSERQVYSYIGRSQNLLLWDRGTYIHRDHVSIPFQLIQDIEVIILKSLDRNIPYLSVHGIFEKYRLLLVENGVPSESALYSCLRESNNKKFSYPEYPYVIKCENDYQKLPLPLVLESYILDRDGIVTLDEVKNFAVEELGVNEDLFNVYHFPKIPNLLRVAPRKYIHISQITIDINRLMPIVDHLASLLDSNEHVSVKKLFNDKKISCKLAGVSDPVFLFSMLQYFFSDRFNLHRYPLISLYRDENQIVQIISLSTKVVHYIRDKESPCSFAELYRHFVENLGYDQFTVYNVAMKNEILRYSEGVVLHIENLFWTRNKQITLESLTTNYICNRENAGKPFGLISHLYENCLDQLPEIPDHIHWTPTLLGELISFEGRYRILGVQRNAFISVPNSYGIETLDDLLYYILDTEYNGAANIEVFIRDMRDVGILKKKLTPMMLGSKSRLVIDGNVVLLAELHYNVE